MKKVRNWFVGGLAKPAQLELKCRNVSGNKTILVVRDKDGDEREIKAECFSEDAGKYIVQSRKRILSNIDRDETVYKDRTLVCRT